MPADTSDNTFVIPVIQPFQLDSGGDGSVDNGVNLFRGNVSFFLDLVSLNGRNGLGVKMAALYTSDIQRQVNRWNRDAPTGIIGLGWDLPFETIESIGPETGAPEDRVYAYLSGGSSNRLHRSTMRWRRGFLDSSLAASLNSGVITALLREAFGSQALRLAVNASITVLQPGQSWRIVDSTSETIFDIEINQPASRLDIYDGGLAYELLSYKPWRIRYYLQFERWEITREDGVSAVFGGHVTQAADGSKSSLGNSVQWGVRWGSWVGPSALTHDPNNAATRVQQQYPTAWNHSLAYTLWGDEVQFEYQQVLQQVGAGGLPYTKACYLSSVTDVFGRQVKLVYDDKIHDASGPYAAREYQDPFKAQPTDEPDAYQSRYETKYLREIHVEDRDGAQLYKLVFDSSPVSYATLPANPASLFGDTQKRTLNSITKLLPNGLGPPPTLLTYYGAGDTNPGALKAITYPKGATVSYTYQQTQLPLCSRSKTISSPLGVGATPRVWFGPDFAVTAWYSPGVLYFEVYTWLGRWQRWTPPRPQLNVFLDLDRLDVTVQEGFFILHYQTQNQTTELWTFHKDVLRLGQWLAYANNPIVIQDPQVSVAAGFNFFAVAQASTSQLTRYTWNELTKLWSSDVVTGLCAVSNPGQTNLFITAHNNYLVSFCYDRYSAPGSKQSVLQLDRRDELGQWTNGNPLPVPNLQIAENPNHPQNPFDGFIHWSPDTAFLACTHVTREGTTSREYSVTVFSWTADEGYRLSPPKEFRYQLSKTGSGDVTIPWVAQVEAGSLIASGPHLLRYNGHDWLSNDNLAIQSQIDSETAFWFAYAQDVAVKTENSASNVIGALQAYDPNQDVTSWQRTPQSLYNGAPDSDYQTRYFPTAAPDYISWDTDLYYRGTSTDWADPLGNPLQPAFPDGIDTTTIINEGPAFFAYYAGTATPQDPTQVEVLRNGQIANTSPLPQNFFRLSQSGVASPGTVPAGASSFLTFLPLDAEFDKAESITLNRLVDDSISAVFNDYPIAVVDIDSGFGHTSTSYEFSISSALCDPSGTVVKYFQSDVYPGTANAFQPTHGHTSHYFINGLPPEQGGDTQYPSVVDGFPHRTVSYDNHGNVVAENLTSWEVFTTVTDLYSGTQNQPIFGVFTRLDEVTSTKDGVGKTLTYDYAAATGMPRTTQSVVYNPDGVAETRVSVTLFGYEVYDWLRNAHLLSPPVQIKQTVALPNQAAIVTSFKTTTWKAFARAPIDGIVTQVYAAFQTYHWLGGAGKSGFDFAAWPATPPTPDWLKTSEVRARTSAGFVSERADPTGSVRSTLFDTAQRFPVAIFTDASIGGGESFYYGFESYENISGWALDTKVTPIVTGNSHTGSRSLQLPGGSVSAPIRLAPSKPTTYLFSCWAKTPANYDASKPAGWSIQCTRPNAQPQTAVLAFAGTQGEWQYYYCEVTGDSAGPVQVAITAFNKGSVAVFVDNVAFATTKGQYLASVYKESTHQITAEVGPYNNSLEWVYNQHLQAISQTGQGGGVKRLSLSYFSRQGSPKSFRPAEPNATLLILPSGATFHDRFNNGGDWTAHWNSAQAADWQSSEGWLLHTPDRAGQISLTRPAFTSNYFVYVDVKASEEITAPIGLQVGTSLTVTWQPGTQTWTLVVSDGNRKKTVNASYTSTGPGDSWLLVMTGQVVLFYVDGRLTCSSAVAQAVQGAPAIVTSNRVGFANFLAGASSEIGAAFVDGSGKTIQRQTVDGTGVVVSAYLYDDVGRAAVITKHARYADPVPKYQPSFATLDWSTGIMTGDVAAANPEDGSFPYSRKRYEDSPVGRVVEVGQPGKVFAVGQGHTTKFEYGANQAGGFPVALNLPGGRYFAVTATNPDGVVSVAIADVIGRKVAHGTLLDAQTKRYVTSSRSVRYTSGGRVITNFLPNYYNPPDPAHKNNWVLTQPYDMLGRLLSTTGPDSGITKFVYDVRGNVRFSQDATAAEQGIVVYSIYDSLGQMLERGTFAFAWDQAQLQQRADGSPSWPGAAQGAQPRYRYTYTYSGDDPNQFGRLTATEAIDGDNPGSSAQVAYSYNPANQLESEVVRNPQYGTDAYTFRYGYDNLGRANLVTYPSGLTVQTQRGPLGNVQSIASSDEQFAAYDYTLAGQVKTETLNPGSAGAITRKYSYNSPGWLTSVDDGLFSETIDYTENGFGGAAYYSGQIAHMQSGFAIGNPGSFPTRMDFACEYDALARLKVAQCLVNGQAAPDWSIGTQSPVTYDDHGNFLSFEQAGKTEKYTYNPGTDFVTNTTGSANADFASNKSGAVTAAKPRGISSIQYDALLGKATRIQLASGEDLRFAYDVDGRRSLKMDAKLTRLYLSGRNPRPLSEKERPRAGGSESTLEYIYGPTGVLGVRRKDGYFTILRDHLGSTRALVTASKTPVAAYHYLPFGQVVDPVFGQKDAARYLFTGYEYDSQTGLYNAGARLYDPLLRRFYSVDPAHQFASPYIYAGNNPIVMVDPSGTVSAAAIAISAVITVVGIIAAIFTFGVGAAFAAGADAAAGIGDAAGALADGVVEGAVNAAPAAGLTAGEKLTVGVLTTASSTVLGAGTSGIQYGATHNGFDGKEFGASLGIGAAGGAVSGAAGYGISLVDGLVLDQAISGLASGGYRLTSIGATALRSGLEGAVAALPGQVASNAISHDPLDSGLLTAFVMGLGEGIAMGAVQESLFPSARARAGNAHANDAGAGAGHAGGDQPGGDMGAGGNAMPQDHPQVQEPVRQLQAPEDQSKALVLWRPSPLAELQSNLARAALESSIPRSISQPLPSLERLVINLTRTVVDLPNGRITIVDRSIFNLPPQVTIEFHNYLALTWHGSGAVGDTI